MLERSWPTRRIPTINYPISRVLLKKKGYRLVCSYPNLAGRIIDYLNYIPLLELLLTGLSELGQKIQMISRWPQGELFLSAI